MHFIRSPFEIQPAFIYHHGFLLHSSKGLVTVLLTHLLSSICPSLPDALLPNASCWDVSFLFPISYSHILSPFRSWSIRVTHRNGTTIVSTVSTISFVRGFYLFWLTFGFVFLSQWHWTILCLLEVNEVEKDFVKALGFTFVTNRIRNNIWTRNLATSLAPNKSQVSPHPWEGLPRL